jgi:hypothetical protein
MSASLTRRSARLALSGLLALLVAGLTTRVPPQPASPTKDKGDAALFSTVVHRMQGGESYYAAMGDELRHRHYPTASVFNWRTPLVFQAAAAAPRMTAIALLALGVICVLGTLILFIKAPPEILLVSLAAQVGAVTSILVIPESVAIAEVWTGFLMLISLVAYGRQRWALGAALGVLALFVRELAAPYCVACGLLALSRRRWRESAVWVIGACAFLAYYSVHVSHVAAHIGPHDLAHPQSWVQFGGLKFVLGTIGFLGWFAALPSWCPPFGLVLLLAALWAPDASVQLRTTIVAYLVFFSIVGQVFNQNWGLVTGPAWALASGYGVAGLSRLISSAWPSRARSGAPDVAR